MPHVRLVTTTLNEAETIPALAKGCKEMGVDSFLILDDDDSIDNTEEVAYREFAAVGIPGKVIKGKFDTLSDKRNHLLSLPETREGLTNSDYLFITQADEPPVGSLDKESLDAPVHLWAVQDGILEWDLPLLVRCDMPCWWVGTVHEYLELGEAPPDGPPYGPIKRFSPVIQRTGSIATRETREEQAHELEKQLEKDATDGRAAFFLAQTYQALGRFDDALKMYTYRATMIEGADQERWCALYRVGMLTEDQNPVQAVRIFMDAWAMRPSRAESLFRLAHLANRMGSYGMAALFAEWGMSTPPTTDLVFVERWIERWGRAYEWSVSAWWLGVSKAYDVMDELLARDDLAPECRVELERNRALPPRSEMQTL